jgi:cytochrome d ubiquinol oxidase subunit I
MQTPQGQGVNAEGQFVPLDWVAIIFNPSFPYRLVHMLLAAYLTTALVVGAVGAWHLLKDKSNPDARTMFAMAMGMVLVTAPIQIFAGDQHGLNTLEHQPAKIMAMEGHYDSHPDGAPLILFGLPDDAKQEMHAQFAVPHAGSLILKHNPNAPMAGLDTIAPQDRPPVSILFWSFRLMVGLGMAMLLLALFAGVQRLRGKLWDSKLLHGFAIAMGPMGFVAVLAGWVTTEVGRQPFTVYGLLRTEHSVGPVAAPAVALSLAAFAVVYFIVFAAGAFYVLRLMSHPPSGDEPDLASAGPIRSAGITPAPAVEARGGKVESDNPEDKR